MSDALLDEIHINMQGRVVMRYAGGKCVDVTDTWGRKLYSAPYPQALQSGEPVGEVFEVLCEGRIVYAEVYDGAVIPHKAKLYTTPQPVVPEGYVLVPVEPTEAMEAAGMVALCGSIGGYESAAVLKAWSAMLSAGKGTV